MSAPIVNIKNDGNGGSPLANLIAHSRDLRASASVGEFESLNRQNAKALLSAAASAGFPLVSEKGNHGFVG